MEDDRGTEQKRTSIRSPTHRNYSQSLQCNGNGVCIKATYASVIYVRENEPPVELGTKNRLR